MFAYYTCTITDYFFLKITIINPDVIISQFSLKNLSVIMLDVHLKVKHDIIM